MARLRYNGLRAVVSTALTTSATSVTFTGALSHAAGNVPTLPVGDTIPLSLLSSTGRLVEVVHVTAYAAGATTATVLRAQEGTPAAAHAAGTVAANTPLASDITALEARPYAPDDSHIVGTASGLGVTYATGWSNFGGGGFFRFKKSPDGTTLYLTFDLTSPGTNNVLVLTLPEGYRPIAKLLNNPCWTNGTAPNNWAIMNVMETGELRFWNNGITGITRCIATYSLPMNL